ncbi:class I SAM-dependent methyltransferase [Bdellovibrio bacteriovorus]|uniref:class I SAM-dependent methyltransferase n=1 Tax=Bdellovibrio bacteriovorus TaxID=959 RepID=UPI0021D0531D|nr:class I SAM-dependent methyltransferase [Bdellovibrio bacteriovorus]UXR64090.1 class I SAM-dependent methyltransferase [Bdellovibrio bacteriovorus]
MDMIKNRLEKNFKKLKSWAERHQIEAFRLYDRDIPEYPYIVDIYKDHFLIYDKSDLRDKDKNHLPHVREALKALFKCDDSKVVIKKRERQEGLKQYEKLDAKEDTFVVRESQALLKVNLYDYLDTGLFLDHRPMRQKVFKTAKDQRFLNLFCYTGSVSVFAALGGARTTSVDMSQTYLRWAQDNFQLNEIELGSHSFVNADVLDWLRSQKNSNSFDMIFLDPPTFSNSKKMEDTFEVERDQDFLVDSCMKMLAPEGVLYFSNNKRKFKISDSILSKYRVKEITTESIPQDFHDKKIHNCFEIRTK